MRVIQPNLKSDGGAGMRLTFRTRCAWLATVFVALVAAWTPGAGLADADAFGGRTILVMVDDAGCVYCAKWDREVKAGYEASPEGKFAPLERRHIGAPELSGLSRLAYTPTFVLMVRGREEGRITGYAGADFFWAEIDRLYAKVGFKPDAVPMPPPVENRAAISGPRPV